MSSNKSFDEVTEAVKSLVAKNGMMVMAEVDQGKMLTFSELRKARSPITGQLGRESYRFSFERRSRAVQVDTPHPDHLVWFVAFLEDLRKFFPHTPVYRFRH